MKGPARSSGAAEAKVPPTDLPHRFVLPPVSLRESPSNWVLRPFHVDKDLSPFHEPVCDFFDSLFASNLAVAHGNKRVRKTSATDRKSDETGYLCRYRQPLGNFFLIGATT